MQEKKNLHLSEKLSPSGIRTRDMNMSTISQSRMLPLSLRFILMDWITMMVLFQKINSGNRPRLSKEIHRKSTLTRL